jgi:hypothetical protein
VIGVHGADRAPDTWRGRIPGFEGADFGLADSVKFLEGEGAGACVGGEIGRERGDALEEFLGAGTEIPLGGKSAKAYSSTWAPVQRETNPPKPFCRSQSALDRVIFARLDGDIAFISSQ